MKKQLITFVAITTLAFTAMQSQAESYFGVSYGASDFDTGVSNLTGTATLDEKDSGFKIFYGFDVAPKIAVEFHYADFGEATLSGNNGDGFDLGGSAYSFIANNAVLTLDGNSIGVSGVYRFIDEGAFVPFVKLGLHRWASEISSTSSSGSGTVSDDGFDIFYGIGADVNVAENFAIRAEYEMYDLDDIDVNLLSIGAKFTF